MGREKPEGWHREKIKAALRMRHRSLEHLSTSWGYHKTAVGVAIAGSVYWPVLERRIAEELQLPPHTLWPDRWTPEGVRKSRAERNLSRPRLDAHRPNARAA